MIDQGDTCRYSQCSALLYLLGVAGWVGDYDREVTIPVWLDASTVYLQSCGTLQLLFAPETKDHLLCWLGVPVPVLLPPALVEVELYGPVEFRQLVLLHSLPSVVAASVSFLLSKSALWGGI